MIFLCCLRFLYLKASYLCLLECTEISSTRKAVHTQVWKAWWNGCRSFCRDFHVLSDSCTNLSSTDRVIIPTSSCRPKTNTNDRFHSTSPDLVFADSAPFRKRLTEPRPLVRLFNPHLEHGVKDAARKAEAQHIQIRSNAG